MNDKEGKKMLQRHEGFRDHIYLDSLGNPTCSWGHHLVEGSKVPLGAAEAFFEQDYLNAVADYAGLIRQFDLGLNMTRRAVLINMIFNMGLPKVLGFKNMLKALQDEDYIQASSEMLASRWRDQVGGRAYELAKMMMEG